ncbi:hypothetical protein [Streptomyces sp. NPDC001816]|uniref:hypothetical protein n=1 Tax=Streptomyces sp. NPDC001816 TaxID=3364612 RepID=UPI0036B40E76
MSFLDGFPSDHIRAALAEYDGVWPLLAPAAYANQDLTDEQIARLVGDGTRHPAATPTEPAVLKRPLAERPRPYVKCVLLNTGHWPMFSTPHELAGILDEAAGRA